MMASGGGSLLQEHNPALKTDGSIASDFNGNRVWSKQYSTFCFKGVINYLCKHRKNIRVGMLTLALRM